MIAGRYGFDRENCILLDLDFIADADEEVNSECSIDFCRDEVV